MAHTDPMKEMAAQLKRPQGAEGIKLAAMMNETNAGMTRHSIDRLNIEAGGLLLEPGHGNCGHLAYLLGKNTGLSYYGLETSELMVQQARQVNKSFVQEKKSNLYCLQRNRYSFCRQFFRSHIYCKHPLFWGRAPASFSRIVPRAKIWRVV